jgi:hypothetical protein
MLTDEEKAKQLEIQAQYGDDCAFFKTRELGFLAFVPPADPATPFWEYQKAQRLDGIDKLGTEIGLALAFATGTPEQKEALAGLFRAKGAFAFNVAKACRRMCGSELKPNPTLESKAELEQVEKLRKEHGEIAYFHAAGFGLVVVASPKNPACFRQLFNDIHSGSYEERPREVQEQFALDCVVYPDRDRVATLLQSKPSLTLKLSVQGQELAGGEYEELGKA